MSIGIRIHVFEEGGSFKKIPYAKFERLISRSSNERLEAYAGKRVRFAMTFVEFYERKVVKIMRTDFIIIPFASDGSVDREEYDRRSSLGINMVDFPIPSMDRNVVNLVPKISRKRYYQEFTWTPRQEDVTAIISDVFPSNIL